MGTVRQLRRGTTAEHSTFTGAVAEVTIDTDKKRIIVHDGVTVGGKITEPSIEDSKSYKSPKKRPNDGTVFTQIHSLGAVPKMIRAYVVIQRAVYGYSVGEELEIGSQAFSNDGGLGFQVSADATSIYIVFGATSNNLIQVLRRDAGFIGQTVALEGNEADVKLIAWA